LSKAPVPSAFLKTRRIVVKYSHNNWYIKRGQASSMTAKCPEYYGTGGLNVAT